jgi:hypothetical protein
MNDREFQKEKTTTAGDPCVLSAEQGFWAAHGGALGAVVWPIERRKVAYILHRRTRECVHQDIKTNKGEPYFGTRR